MTRVGSHILTPAASNARFLAASELRAARKRLVSAIAATQRSGDTEAQAGCELAVDVIDDVRAELGNHRWEGSE